jgi:tetratricopeptide (TPR) repeat protein
MRRFSVALACSIGGLSSTGHVFAGEVHQYPECGKQPSESEVQGAQGAYQAGLGSYNEADYERAILYWEDAFRRDCTATLLLHHLARAYEGQGNLDQAIVALRAYLERSPNATERPQIQKRIEVFEQKLEEERTRKQDEAERKKQADDVKAKPDAAHSSSAPSSSGLYVNPLIPITVAGVGVVATVVGSVVYFPAKSDMNKAEDDCGGSRDGCSSDIVAAGNDARDKAKWGGPVAITGLVLAAGGVGWYFFNESRAPKRTAVSVPAVQPWVTPQAAGVAWRGTF